MNRFYLTALLLSSACIVLTAPVKAAQAGVYAQNDLLLFFQNPAGTTGTDKVVYFNLGSTINVFRDAATPSSGAFGSTISLGNINTVLSNNYGNDWTGLSSSIFVAANGQNGSTSGSSTGTSNGDFARTVYITKPRTSPGTVGQANSLSPLFAPSQTPVAGNIQGANNISGMSQPGVAFAGGTTPPLTLLDNYNPFFNGNPATAYDAINGGLMGAVTNVPYTFGSVSNVVRALDLYRVAKVSGNGTTNASIWQNSNNIAATISNDFGVAGGGSAAGYYLGTITLSDNGDVNFVATGNTSEDDYTVWANGWIQQDPSATTLTNQAGDYDNDGFLNVDEYAFGTDPTVGNAALTYASRVSNNISVSFFQRSSTNSGAPTYSVASSASVTNAFTNNPSISISNSTNTPPNGYEAAFFTQPISGKNFYRVDATVP